MKIPDRGCAESLVFEKLDSFRESDLDLASGRMFGHAFIINDEVKRIVERAYMMYLWENALDPTLFPSLMRMENEIVAMSAAHLRGDGEVVGNFTSGGTESILLAVKTARDKAKAERPAIREPEMILPVTAHAAFHKAARYFCVKPVMTPVDPVTFKADVGAVKEAVTENTVMIAASAPSYAHGVVDPIPEIGEMALERGIPFHVDGCIGAFMLPYFKRLGAEVTDFDFRVPGVTSISMDFHKYAFTAKGASVILYRNKDLRKYQIFACSGWTGYTLINPTFQSSRSGGPLAATWAALNYLGDEGYLDAARKLKEATQRIIEGVNSIPGLHVLGKPAMCILGVGSEKAGVFHIVDEMKQRGWHIQAQFGLGDLKENFHVTVLPLNVERIEAWIRDLRECVEIAGSRGRGGLKEKLADALSQAGQAGIEGMDLGAVFKAAGIEGNKLPARMAEINELVNSLPPELADELFTAFYNEVNRYKE